MSDRPNHVLAGLIFVGVCILIAVVAFLLTRPSTSSVAVSDNAAVNTIVADLSSGPVASEEASVQPSAVPVTASGSGGEGTPQIGACHMGKCSWSIERARDTVREETVGRLIKLTLQGGTSRHASNAYPQAFAPGVKVAWNGALHEVYVFCSITLPAVMSKADGTWQTDVLDFVNGPPGVLDSSAALYARTCHGADVDYPSEGFAARYGYVEAPFEYGEPVVTTPNDIFELARSAAQPG